jgi:transcriptional regulator with XRE-family HTH domain
MSEHQIDKVKKIDLAAFDEKLRAMAEEGAFDSAMEGSLDRLFRQTEPKQLKKSEKNRFCNTVIKASARKAIIDARSKTPISNLPFGRFLQLVRDRSGLSHVQVAIALNKEASFVERLENGQISPLKLMPNEVADVMQLFRLTITEISATLKTFLSTISVKRQRVSGMARSSVRSDAEDKGASLAHAMDALQAAIKKKNDRGQPDVVKIDPVYLENLRQELENRNAKELLK